MNPFVNLLPGASILTDVPLATRTTWRIGGLAKWLLRPTSVAQLAQLLEQWPMEIPRLLLGGGSNLLIADAGFQGAVVDLTYGMKQIYTVTESMNRCIVHVDGGGSTSRLAHFARQSGLSGAEFLGGIPGSIGGAVRMNAGAYGSEIKDIISHADLLDPQGTTHRWSVEQLGLGYRTSGILDNWIVTGACFDLQRDDPQRIRTRMVGFNQRRRASQPLELPSAGSVFKNPPGGGPKAWELINQAGLRGMSRGDAQVSMKHSNFFVNRGHARGEEMLGLIHQVTEVVERQTSILLEPEVKLIGF